MRPYLGMALVPAILLALLTASLYAPFAFEAPLVRWLGARVDAVQTALALALHYFGRWAALWVIVLGIVYYWRGERRMAALLVTAPALAALGSYILKICMERARPEILPHLVAQTDPSFPSGHSTFAAALAVVFMLRYRRGAVLAAGMALILLMGWSRLVLGVHYPVDVLAGYCMGMIWALVMFALFRPDGKRV